MGIKEFSPKDADTLPQTSGPLPFDAEKYLEHVDDLALSESQKIEFLRTLWNIMSAFVDLGFGVDSVMTILAQRASENGADAVNNKIPTHDFNIAVDDLAEEPE